MPLCTICCDRRKTAFVVLHPPSEGERAQLHLRALQAHIICNDCAVRIEPLCPFCRVPLAITGVTETNAPEEHCCSTVRIPRNGTQTIEYVWCQGSLREDADFCSHHSALVRQDGQQGQVMQDASAIHVAAAAAVQVSAPLQQQQQVFQGLRVTNETLDTTGNWVSRAMQAAETAAADQAQLAGMLDAFTAQQQSVSHYARLGSAAIAAMLQRHGANGLNRMGMRVAFNPPPAPPLPPAREEVSDEELSRMANAILGID
jgi:hypothetical protein